MDATEFDDFLGALESEASVGVGETPFPSDPPAVDESPYDHDAALASALSDLPHSPAPQLTQMLEALNDGAAGVFLGSLKASRMHC